MEDILNELSSIKAKRAGITDKQESSINVSDPTAIKALMIPGFPLKDIPSKLKLLIFSLSLYYWGVPLSTLGQWFSCHKTTILRNLMGLALSLWPTVESWIINNTKARIVYIDEKWLKIKGKWHYWFVVLDKETGLPVLSSLLSSLSNSATKLIALKLKALGKIPKVIITDGLASYKKMFKGVYHQICTFHHQQGVSRFLKERFETKEEQQKPKREIQTTIREQLNVVFRFLAFSLITEQLFSIAA